MTNTICHVDAPPNNQRRAFDIRKRRVRHKNTNVVSYSYSAVLTGTHLKSEPFNDSQKATHWAQKKLMEMDASRSVSRMSNNEVAGTSRSSWSSYSQTYCTAREVLHDFANLNFQNSQTDFYPRVFCFDSGTMLSEFLVKKKLPFLFC